jgi:hypothetical protein
MYLVIFYESYVGCHVDEYSKVFSIEKDAKKYAKKLNAKFAKANMCRVKDLGDYYIVEKILS